MADYQMLKTTGIDTDEGLACCADDAEFYEDMLTEYISEAQAGVEELKQFYTTQDWKHYGIRAHSVKSTSRMIGATAFSETAREMEFAARDGRIEEIMKSHTSFLSGYQKLVEGIQKALV